MQIILDAIAERLKEKAPESEAGRRTGVAPFQGDIILSDSTVAALVSGALPKEVIERRMRRAVMNNAIKRWPNATVPYKFSSNFREFQIVYPFVIWYKTVAPFPQFFFLSPQKLWNCCYIL